jgi:hypothetical protein
VRDPPPEVELVRSLLLLGLLVGLGFPVAAQAAASRPSTCTVPLTAADLGLLLDDAEAAWIRLDPTAFTAATDDLAGRVLCLADEPDRALVARYHRVQGLRAFLVRDEERAERAFASARRIEPAAHLPTTLVPEGNPIQAAYSALPLDAVVLEPVPAPASGGLWFDGAAARERPANVPTLFQWRGSDGAIAATAYVWPGEPLPAYPVGPGSRSGARRTLLLAAAAGELVAAGLYVGAVVNHAAFEDRDTRVDALDGLAARANGFNAAAIGVGIAGGATAVVAFVVPWGR